MATLEKLIKAFEILKIQPLGIPTDGQITNKKKDIPVNKKDKITQCSMIADAICSQNLRSVSDFPKYLGIAIETFLLFCDDEDSDVRMVADECLNRTIKSLLDTHLGRLQVELYKEIKKEASPRRLRAALTRFADLCHLIRPQKCRAYTINFLPCLTKISQYTEEAVQETLGTAISKIMPTLGKFTNDGEVKVLLKAFLPNLSSAVAVIRRTAATSLVSICQHSRKPIASYIWLLTELLDLVVPVSIDQSVPMILGVLLCLRHLVPHLSETSQQQYIMKGSIGLKQKDDDVRVHPDQLIQVYELLLHFCHHSDHNVITASLEALQQLLRTPPKALFDLLLSPDGIPRSYIYSVDRLAPSARFKSESQLLSFSSPDDEDAQLEDEPLSSEPVSQTDASLDDILAATLEDRSRHSESDSGLQEEQLDQRSVASAEADLDELSEQSIIPSNNNSVFSPEGRWSPFSAPLGVHQKSKKKPPPLRSVASDEKILGGFELSSELDQAISVASSPGITSEFKVGSIGSMTDHQVALNHCTRLLCNSFLLTGSPGGLMPDRNVRVSIKSLAVGCLGSIFTLDPKTFFLDLHTSSATDVIIDFQGQKVWDVLLLSGHHDPYLRGHVALLLGSVLQFGLREAGGCWERWARSLSVSGDIPTLESLLVRLLTVAQDESSVATRLGLSALRLSLQTLLLLAPAYMGLRVLEVLFNLRENPYWLVKVELMELVSEVPFRSLHHLEVVESGAHPLQPRSVSYQQRFLDSVLLHLLGDEDYRVRHAAASAIVKLIPELFYPLDHPFQDPVIAQARSETEQLLEPCLIENRRPVVPLVHGLVKPFLQQPQQKHPTGSTNIVEATLSRVIASLVKALLSTTNKYLMFGCCHTLCQLSEAFPGTIYLQSWTSAHSEPQLMSVGNTLRRQNSGSNSSPAESLEIVPNNDADLLNHLVVLITSTPVSFDLLTHQHVLQLIGNLFTGCCFQMLSSQNKGGDISSSSETTRWTISTDTSMSKLLERLFTHIARLLNIFMLVIEEQVPAMQNKPSLPSLPTAPTLSPIKRKSRAGLPKDDGSGLSTNAVGAVGAFSPSSAAKGSPNKIMTEKSDVEKERVTSRGGTGIGQFASQPLYVKLYDMFKATHSSYKISMDLTGDKFRGLLNTVLDVLSQLLEVTTLEEMGKHAEELLGYAKSVMALVPCSAIQFIRQLLKCIFGTNLVCMWEDTSVGGLGGGGRKPGRATRLSNNLTPGLYHICFSSPYASLTQSLAGSGVKPSALSLESNELGSWLSWMRRRSEKKLASLLKSGSKADTSTLSAHIRLFEPVVIKALKQYTVSSCVQLQCQVLDLLAQLVQLRVNYCLLDADQIFINFVIKQFECIEEGQIPGSEILIPRIFYFLVLLSYERYHSKAIIGVSKIIQLCDGLMASGQPPSFCAIPALQPVVEDLFLLRGSNKLDSGKELDAQREVVVSILLRLVHYPQVLEMFLLIFHQSHKEGEDRWKKLSRQVVDNVLPLLARQQILLNDQTSLNILHQLFEAVAPSVFRPVDILLKVLFATPQDLRSPSNLERWLCLVLSLTRVLLVQGKEEVLLARLGDLGLPVTVPKYRQHVSQPPIPLPIPVYIDPLQGNPHPEITFARFLFQVVGVALEALHSYLFCPLLRHHGHSFLCQQMAHFLLYMTHMFQSGVFRRITTSAMSLLKSDLSPGALEDANHSSSFYSINEINAAFLDLVWGFPTLTLQWCNILILLNYNHHNYWTQILKTCNRRPPQHPPSSPSPKYCTENLKPSFVSCNSEVVRRGGLILFCDYVCENLNDAEQMTWLIINHVSDLVQLMHEPPVQDLMGAVHRNAAASGLFVQAIQARCDDFSKPSFSHRALQCLEGMHPSQSWALVSLLASKFLSGCQVAMACRFSYLACRRLKALLADSLEVIKGQVTLEDAQKIRSIFTNNAALQRRHQQLVLLIDQVISVLCGEQDPPEVSNVQTEPAFPNNNINKEWFLRQVESQCFRRNPPLKKCALLLSKLSYEDNLSLMNTKEFHVPILQQCLTLGAQQISNREARIASPNFDPSSPMSATSIEAAQNEFPLFCAARTTLLQRVAQLVAVLPKQHQLFTLRGGGEASTPREAKYRVRLVEVFQEGFNWDSLFHLLQGLLCYLNCLSSLPACNAVLWDLPLSSLQDVARLGVLCAESILWMLESRQKASCENVHLALKTMDAILRCGSLAAVIGLEEHMTWVCVCISAVYNYLLLCKQELPSLSFPTGKDGNTNQEDIRAQQACVQVAQLIGWLEDGIQLDSNIPSFIMTPLKNIIRGLARLPLVNSFARTPPVLWRLGWSPEIAGPFHTQVPPPPGEFLQERDVLLQYIFRVNLLGWTSRQQFEETWMALLGVLSATPLGDHQAEEEEQERVLASCMAVKSITALLLHTLLLPQPGNPHGSRFLRQARDKPLAFLHTRNPHLLSSNTERVASHVEYSMGQVSLEYLCVTASLLEDLTGGGTSPSTDSIAAESSSSGSSSAASPSSSNIHPHSGLMASMMLGDGAASSQQREQSLAALGLDIHSCLHFLLDLYSQWLSAESCSRTPLVLLTEVTRSVVMLSDIFMERLQFEWMLDTLLELHRLHPAEDEVIAQYLMYGICKATAVLNMEQEMLEKLRKLVEMSLKSSFLPTCLATLYGLLYLLEQGGGDETFPLLSTATDYLSHHLEPATLPKCSNEDHALIMWALAFYVLENYQDNISDTDFGQKIFQLSLRVCGSFEELVPMSVYSSVLHGLERLLVAESVNAKEAEMVVKISVERLRNGSPARSLLALGVLFSCMFISKDTDQWHSVRKGDNQNLQSGDASRGQADPEQLIAAMERVTVIFDRIKRSLPFEAEVVSQVLPSFLMEFFPAQDVLNKVIGEFVSSQQPYPQLLCSVLFQVFEHLHAQSQEEIIQDWVVLSLCNFAQRAPLSMAVWSLTCCFVSASSNPWLRALFPYVQNRMGLMEDCDKALFCTAGLQFRNQLQSEELKESFRGAFGSLADLGSPYSDLYTRL